MREESQKGLQPLQSRGPSLGSWTRQEVTGDEEGDLFAALKDRSSTIFCSPLLSLSQSQPSVTTQLASEKRLQPRGTCTSGKLQRILANREAGEFTDSREDEQLTVSCFILGESQAKV